jgi:acetyl-CoA carboxylase biotin carboxylase subunit
VSRPSKVLIANRGEIAARIIRTLREMGIASVVVCHTADRDSLAARAADEFVEIAGEPPVAAYLDGAAIVDAAVRAGADAIHPGFGFLAENAGFAQAVLDAGLIFIGPPPAAIRAMGDKIESKRLARAAGVPVVPGSEDALGSEDEAVAEADRIGYPVLLKASAGGGGKGMRIARDPDACGDAYQRASQEAQAAFGDGRVFVERYVERPRHIEVQVLADGHGNIVSLGERECSIQRRYQKVIEEAPSPFIDAEVREEMSARAVALARAVGYVSAGTVEMVVDAERNFYFLEMNTRLQVEHPVTELITGIDIVAEQVRVAGGEPLSFRQDDVALEGHAIECRIYAEDPSNEFLPETGTLQLVRFPSGPGVRVDHGVTEGEPITPAFDPMIAKVIGYGETRAVAIERTRQALRDTVLLGTVTNTAFLERVLAHPEFSEGLIHTAFLAEHPELLGAPSLSEEQSRLLIAAAALASPRYDRRHALPEPLASLGAWRP